MKIEEDARLGLNLSNNALERLDGEYVIISFDTGKYFSVNTTGSDLLSLIAQGVNQREWNSILGDYYQQSHLDGIPEFIAECLREGIIVRTDTTTESSKELPADHKRNAWTTPVLKTFDDLSDLLLVDPIHESSTDGWPAPKPE